MKDGKGISFVELLVVIAIITFLLLAILTSSLKRAKGTARLVACRNNIRLACTAMRSYADGYDGRLFPLEDEQDKFWFDALAPYLRRDDEIRDILHCPTARMHMREKEKIIFGTARIPWRVAGMEGGYAINGWLFPDGELTKEKVPLEDTQKLYGRFSEIDSPAETPAFGDCNWFVSWPYATDKMPANLETGTPPDAKPQNHMGRFYIERHDYAKDWIINLGFADGHAERKQLDELWSLKWHRGFETSKRPPEYEAPSK